MLKGKKIILAVTGSIAAYKSATIIRLLVKKGASVKVIMTDAAASFITPLTLSTLSKDEVLTDLTENGTWTNHVMLGRWADLMLIAPLSCNSLSKMAHGVCDNLLAAVYLSATCPVIVAPAMDEDMWKHPSTRQNIRTIRIYGDEVIEVNEGELASGLTGPGRMAEPEAIIGLLEDHFNKEQDLAGKKVLLTAGPTREAIDPVRYISNNSTGKMGLAIAEECRKRGASVTLIYGPGTEPVPEGITTIRIHSAEEMFDACVDLFKDNDIAIMCAAVADYTPVEVAKEKIKKKENSFTLELRKTPDILKKIAALKRTNQLVVGFALETNNEKEHALKKLKEKNADMIILNSLRDEGAGFGHDSNKITIFDRKGGEYYFDTKSKKGVAMDIINSIIQFLHA